MTNTNDTRDLAALQAKAVALLASNPNMARARVSGETGRDVRAAARAAIAAGKAARDALNATLDREREQAGDEWEIARLAHARSLAVERDAWRAALSVEIASYVDGLTVADRDGLSAKAYGRKLRYEALETHTGVECTLCNMRAMLADLRERIATLYSEPITRVSIGAGGKLYRSAVFHDYRVSRGGDYEDIVQDAIMLALLDIRNGSAKAYPGTGLPTVGHVMGKLKWAHRDMLDVWRGQTFRGMIAVHSLDELVALDAIGAVESIDRYGYALAPSATIAAGTFWDDVATAASFTDLARMAKSVEDASARLRQARRAGSTPAIKSAERVLAQAETCEREMIIAAMRERNAEHTRRARLARLSDASKATVATDVRQRTNVALGAVQWLTEGWSLSDVATVLGTTIDALTASIHQLAAPVLATS